ncbi:MAG: helix-turn-helix domain-containing protein [Candidatus Omnitrophica bacterium]|jgi:two-component system nitrogen regulation response regulator GlnG|nr:helix-turn-helix domain-containing protein [Candidatus Omnitrophota bacterium]
MITMLIADNEDKAKEIIASMLSKIGNTSIGIIKQGSIIKIAEKESLKEMIPLKDKIIELGDLFYIEKKGALYGSILDAVERPLIEYILERTEGNQLKAARILGLNRNTIRAKIKKLGIDPHKWKI